MSYCPNCGNKVDETMAFCPRCGVPLKDETIPGQVPPVPPYRNDKQEKQEKNQNHEKGEKQEKSDNGFVGYLIGGLILITIGVFGLLDLTNPRNSVQDLAAMLLIIGVIIIIGAVYIAITARKKIPSTKLDQPSKNMQ